MDEEKKHNAFGNVYLARFFSTISDTIDKPKPFVSPFDRGHTGQAARLLR